jgi:uncharacterized protein YjbJ (UPF0337 family)
MTRARLGAEGRRILGALKEWLGRLAGNNALRIRGERDRWLGRMEVNYSIIRRTPLL